MYAELDCPYCWARVGYIEGLDILIRVDDPEKTPCFHVVDSRAGKFDITVSLLEPRCLHPFSDARLTDESIHDLNKFMHSTPKHRYFKTFYEQTVFLWNNQNPQGTQVDIIKDEKGNAIIPDYSALN